MPRRGWRAVETPAGWYEVIRGPRPSSVKWPVAQAKQVAPRGGRWRGARTVADSKGATVPSVPPDIAREGARNCVSQLQTAIAAFGSYDGVARGDEEGAAGSPGASYLKSDQRMRGVHCSSGEAFGSPRPAQDEIGIRFGGWPKPIAAFARS